MTNFVPFLKLQPYGEENMNSHISNFNKKKSD